MADVKIDGNAFNEFIIQAVVDSSIGDVVRGAVQKSVESYDAKRSIEAAVTVAIREMITDTIDHEEGTRKRVQAMVAEKLTDDVLSEIVGKAFDKLRRDY